MGPASGFVGLLQNGAGGRWCCKYTMAALQAVSSSLDQQFEAAVACRCYRGCAGLEMTSPLTYSAAHTEDIHLVSVCRHLLLLGDFQRHLISDAALSAGCGPHQSAAWSSANVCSRIQPRLHDPGKGTD